jgi:sulfoxide reductase catalytic subunit YedY
MPKIPTYTEIEDFRISINGLVDKPLYVSLQDLKTKYNQVEITAGLQCGGNSRSAFNPTTSGIQWGNGAMGCAKWKGVRLKDLLKRAGLDKEAKWMHFNGGDRAQFYKTASLVRELEIGEIGDDVIIAYEMNGEDLPYLNGYPVRLIIPGWYSDSWVKQINNITVTKEYKELFYMDVAYRIPDSDCECETPDKLASKTKPITTMNIKSLIGFPTKDTVVKVDTMMIARGVAFDGGFGIKEVLISLDEGNSWQNSMLDDEIDPYAFRGFRFKFKPTKKGSYTIMVKAVNRLGEEQPFPKDIKWNHGGYKYNGIDSVTFKVV